MLPTKKHQTWLPSIFNDFLGNEWITKTNETAPSINIIECDKCYKVEIATPGMTKDDFSIEIHDDNHLVITMEKECGCYSPAGHKDEKTSDHKDEKAAEKKDDTHTHKAPKEEESHCGCTNKPTDEHNAKYLRREFSYSQFKQTLILPENVDKTKISAKQEHGILRITLPKKESFLEAQAVKKIAIK